VAALFDTRHCASGSGSGTAAGASRGTAAAAQQLCSDLVSFLEERGGVVASEELVEAFRSRVVPEQMPLFKQVLRQVAGLRRRTGGGEWVMRPEFATAAAAASSPGGCNTDVGGGGGASGETRRRPDIGGERGGG
ncbi:hypothetical protein Vretimale_13238, partial [Volvox reticuliferus]